MRLIVILAAILVIPAVGLSSVPNENVEKAKVSAADKANIQTALGQLPLYFIENKGQMDEEVSYYVKGLDKILYFTSKGITFVLTGKDGSKDKRWTVKLEFVGANEVEPKGEEKQKAVFSYFKGKPEEWNTGIPTFKKLIYNDLWPGIDLVYFGTGNCLKYEFVVKPGSDPGKIRLAYHGTSEVSIMRTGALRVSTPVGGFEDGVPYAYQILEGEQKKVSMRYVLKEHGDDVYSYGFDLGAYDPDEPLILDPDMLVYCGYIGGSGTESATGGWVNGNKIAVDDQGNAYVIAYTNSDELSFPTVIGPDLTYNGGNGDVFIAKVNPQGTGLIYCGYIGGNAKETVGGISVDSQGNAYLIGHTTSDQTSFPVTLGPDLTFNGSCDVFVTKVNAQGTQLTYCGYIGGAGKDETGGIEVDSQGNAYVSGSTASDETSFPVIAGPDLSYNGGWDAFVAKVDSQGTGLVYCGYIGGDSEDQSQDNALDNQGNAYIAGFTKSDESSFPVLIGPDLTYNGKDDGFVAKVNPQGTGLVYCGYIGGTDDDSINGGIAVDKLGNAFVSGNTHSSHNNFPVIVGPDLTYNGGFWDGFVAKVNAQGTGLDYCGYIGGIYQESGYGIAVNEKGNAYVIGATQSDETSFPVIVGPDLTHNGPSGTYDIFIAMVDDKGTGLMYCGYIGGSGDNEFGCGVSIDSQGNAFVMGHTDSNESSFPVLVGPDLTFNGIRDVFVAKVMRLSLMADSYELSESKGGAVNFTLDAGLLHANRKYIVLGSISGTEPGITLPGGMATLPLNWDIFTGLVINLLNTPVFSNFMGKLDANGTATATFDTLGPFAGGAGLKLYFAYALNNPWDFVSNQVGIEIVP